MCSSDNHLQANLTTLAERISAAAARAGRSAGAITLVAVGKTFPASAVAALARAGQRHFGESYVQEALAKIDAVRAMTDAALIWHFIGPIQSNKTRQIAARFDWVQSVDRLKIAQRLSEQRPTDRPPLNVLLQINISGEVSKQGVTPAGLPALARAVAALPRLRLRGLMAIPEASDNPARQRAPLAALRALYEAQRAAGFADWDTLSMGMTAALDAAIAEGATMVRVGTALFGERPRAAAASTIREPG